MFILPVPSPQVTERYGGPLHVLQEAYKTWEDCQLLDYFLDYEDALEKAINYLAGSHHELVDINYRMILVEYIYNYCCTKIEQDLPMYSECGQAIIAFLKEPHSYAALALKENGERLMAWLCTQWADSFLTEKGGDRTQAVHTLVQRLAGAEIPNATSPHQQHVVDALYGNACWDVYSTIPNTELAGALWSTGIEPIKAGVTAYEVQPIADIPDDLAM